MLDERPLAAPPTDLDHTEPGPRASADADAGAATGRTDRVWLAITAFVVTVCTWAFTGDRVIFHLLPDEAVALEMARWMAGRNRWNMFDHSTWQPALSVLITPAYWFTDDPEALVRWGLLINALAMGAAAAVTVVLARRIGRLSSRTAALFAIAVALTPGALSGAGYLWAEPLVVLSFVTVTLGALRTLDGSDPRWTYGATVAAALGYFAHGRLLPFAFTTIATLVGITLWQRRRGVAAIATACGLASIASVRLATWIVHRNVWDETGDVNTAGSVFERLEDPLEVADHLVGQIWYLLVVTLGVGAVGTVVVIRALLTGDRDSDGPIDRGTAIVVFALTAPQLVVSAAFLAGRPRADQLVYGRYNEAVFWPILIVGLCWLRRLARSGWSRQRAIDICLTIAAVVAIAIVVEVRHGDVLDGDIGLRSMVPGILPFVGRTDAVPVVRITLTVLAVIAVGMACATWLRNRPTLLTSTAVVAATTALLVGGVRTHDGEARLLNGWTRMTVVRDIDAIVPADAPLAVKTVRDRLDPSLSWERQRHRYQVFQLYLPHRTFVRDRGVDDAVGPYVFAPRDDPELVAAGATVLWEDPTADLDLYLEPEPRRVPDS